MHSEPGRALSTCSWKAAPAGLKPAGIRNNQPSCTNNHFQSKTQMMLIWATLSSQKVNKGLKKKLRQRVAANSFSQQTRPKPAKLLRAGFISPSRRPPGHEDSGYFFLFSSLALVTIEMGRTCSLEVISSSFCWMRWSPSAVFRNQSHQRAFLPYVFHPEVLPDCFWRRLVRGMQHSSAHEAQEALICHQHSSGRSWYLLEPRIPWWKTFTNTEQRVGPK